VVPPARDLPGTNCSSPDPGACPTIVKKPMGATLRSDDLDVVPKRIGECSKRAGALDKTVFANFIGRFLGPALSGAGLSTRVMLGGALDASSDTDFVNAVLADSTATGYCAVAGLGYDMVAASKVTALKSAGLPFWVSEHRAGNYNWLASYQPIAPNDMAYGIETWGLIRDAITKVGVSAYNAWHMVLNKAGPHLEALRHW